MAWNPAIPVTGADLLSAPVRDNFAALDTQVVGPLVTLAPNLVLMVGASDNLAAVPAGTNGFILTLVGGVPLWQPAPTGVAYPLLAPDGTIAAPSYSFAGNSGLGMFRDGAGHLTLASGTALLVLSRGGGVAWWVDSANGWQPGADAFQDIGAAATQIKNIFTVGTTFPHLAAASIPTPPSGKTTIFAGTDKGVYQKDDAGVVTALAGGGGGAANTTLRLPISQADVSDGSTDNLPAEFVREISTGTLANAPKPTRTYARFDGTTDETLMWSFPIPQNYVSGGTIRLKWKAPSAVAANVIWKAGAAVTIDGSTNDNTLAFTAVDLAAASAVPGTAGLSTEVTIALTTTNFAAGRWVTLFVGRDPNNAGDTYNGVDAILMSVQFEYA